MRTNWSVVTEPWTTTVGTSYAQAASTRPLHWAQASRKKRPGDAATRRRASGPSRSGSRKKGFDAALDVGVKGRFVISSMRKATGSLGRSRSTRTTYSWRISPKLCRFAYCTQSSKASRAVVSATILNALDLGYEFG